MVLNTRHSLLCSVYNNATNRFYMYFLSTRLKKKRFFFILFKTNNLTTKIFYSNIQFNYMYFRWCLKLFHIITQTKKNSLVFLILDQWIIATPHFNLFIFKFQERGEGRGEAYSFMIYMEDNVRFSIEMTSSTLVAIYIYWVLTWTGGSQGK